MRERPLNPYSVITVSKYTPGVLVSALTQHQQRVLWEGIKALEPLTAELIQNDAGFADIKTGFQATLFIYLADFNRFIAAGQRIIEERHHARTV